MIKQYNLAKFLLFFISIFISSYSYAINNKNIILFIWDGLRPDSISPQITPNLYKISREGTYFSDNHSSFPTFTMMNAASFATGDLAGKTGFYGNVLWNNKANGTDSSGKIVDFQQPVFTEDYNVLMDLDKQQPLTEAYTLLDQANKQGILTATIGKSGPAFFQSYKNMGIIFDEMHVFPLTFANSLKSINYPLPINTIYSYPNFTLNKNNGNPTIADKTVYLDDQVTSDPSMGIKSQYNNGNNYLMDSYLNQILSTYQPKLTVIWLRNPDTTEHYYGVGSLAYYDALSSQDFLLGKLISHLKQLKKWENTDLIVASDHGHSNVSGSLVQFPLRTIKDGKTGAIDNISGYSVSGNFRPADLLNRAGFKAFDGQGCQYDPVLSGVTKDNKFVYPTLYDNIGKICGIKATITASKVNTNNAGMKYNTPSYIVPKQLPPDAIIVANNGGSTYFYVPSHDKTLVSKLVRFCQSRQEFGAVFSDSKYGNIPGTIKLDIVKLDNNQNRNPDLIVSSNYNANQRIQGFAGTEFNSSGHKERGMHGSFSPIDVHNTLIAYGPDFKKRYVDKLPSGNIDVAPTIAYLLGINFKNTEGRVLLEALADKPYPNNYNLIVNTYKSTQPATNIVYKLATSPEGKDIDQNVSNYDVVLHTKTIKQNSQDYTYFDSAEALRY
ncbi:MAG: alkaline phosphatase family protein [Neisseriaceae bacterium]